MVITHYTVTCNNGHQTTRPHNDITHCDICGEKVSWGWTIETERKSDLTKDVLLERILNWLERHEESGYSNYGYIGDLQEYDGGETVIIANWNKLPDKLTSFIEHKIDCICGFEDSYHMCECGKIIITEPGYYGGQGDYFLTEYDLLCRQCAIDSIDEIIERVKNDSNKTVKTWMIEAIKEQGFTCLEKENEECPIYETGYHPGQNDDPHKIAKWIEKNLPKHDYIFALTDVGQFDVHWTAFIRRVEE